MSETSLSKRKRDEIELHNLMRDPSLEANQETYDYLRSNTKFYSIVRRGDDYFKQWMQFRAGTNKNVLDVGCGNGENVIRLGQQGFRAVGIDISDVSVENARQTAREQNLTDNVSFEVMDAENMQFPNDTFDIVVCRGVLHHLDLTQVLPEIARVLRPTGEAIAVEPLAYNPLIQLYRQCTPHLRTEWEAEHILTYEDLDLARSIFGQVDVKFFHLATLAAVPFRNTPWFETLLSCLENVDNILLNVPVVQPMAWQMIIMMSQPGKPSSGLSFVETKKQSERNMLLSSLAVVGIIGAIFLIRSIMSEIDQTRG